MYVYDNYSVSACFYLAAHGSYGIIWLLKHALIPDPKWDTKTTVVGQFLTFVLVLGPYWLAPYVLISGMAPAPSVGRCCAAMVCYVIGVVLMMLSDCYKLVTLRHKRGLVTDGPFALCRHPNYLGEMMVYGGFAAMVPHWIPWAVLAWVWLEGFLPNMLLKEASMSRYPNWDQYYRSTGMLLPWLPALLKAKQV
uniref:Steroid 5-alpha reductase C-terminal domain-containing protein n=1 Tax=Haptolina ericina TaxID=156174 RepID=A0A7S3AQT7_9EUKA